jgi:AbrB family looped-hinge helix DNA binding protein
LYSIPKVRRQTVAELVLAKVSRKGQMTIPQELRKALGIQAGDYVALRPLEGGVFLSKASVSPQVKAEDAFPHLLGPSDRHVEQRGAKGDEDLNEAVEEIEDQIYRDSTAG